MSGYEYPQFTGVAGGGGVGISAAGQSASSGVVTFANSNGVSFGMVGSVITATVTPGAAAGVAAASAGTQQMTSGTLKFADGGGVTFGLSNSSVLTASVKTDYLTTAQPPGAYLTTARASNDAIGLNTAATQVTWTVNSSGISFNAGAYLTTAQPVGAYLTTARASNDAIGLGTAQTNVTWTVNSSGLSFNAGGYAGTTSGTQSTAGSDLVFTHNTLGINFGVPKWLTTAQSAGAYLTTARASNDAIGLNTAATSVTWTVNSSGISLNAGAYLTTADLSANSSKYAGTASGFTGANISGSMTHNTQGLSLSLSVAAPGAAAENNWFTLAGNVVGNSSASGSTIMLSGGNNITLSGTNGSQIIISAGAGGAGGAALGMSTNGDTSGNTGTFTSGTYIFAGSNSLTMHQSTGAGGVHTLWVKPAMSQVTAGNNISLSSNGSTLTINAQAVGLGTAQTNVTWTVNTAGISFNAGNYAGTSSGFTGANISASITNNSAGLAMSMSVAAPGGGGALTLSGFDNFGNQEFLAIAGLNSTLWIDRLDLPCAVQFDRVGIRVTHSNASNSSGSATITARVGFYTRNASTLSLLASTSFTTAITASGTAGSYSNYGGIKILPIPWTTTITGGNYWVGLLTITATAGANMTFGNLANSQLASTMSGFFGSGSNITNGVRFAEGVYSAATTALPAAISITQINGNSSAFLRQPAYIFLTNIF